MQVAGMITFYVMSKGTHPFEPPASGTKTTDTLIIEGQSTLSAVKDKVALDLVKSMLDSEPSKRPSATKLLK